MNEEKKSREFDRTKREHCVEALARFLCVLTNIQPIDQLDGSPNWWMFNETATNVINDLEKRGFLRDLT
jgi:hypothetical protein